MTNLNGVLYGLTLLLCGGYAGMTLFCQIGLLPAMRHLERPAYISLWGVFDARLERSLPPYKGTLLMANLASALCLFAQHRLPLALLSSISFLLSVGALVLTLGKQVPLSRRMIEFPQAAEERLLVAMRKQTEVNFGVRLAMAVFAFAALCGGIVAFPIR